jgi:hypothetical protein
VNRQVQGLVQNVAQNAPVGSEAAVAFLQQGASLANTGYENVQKASNQAVDVAIDHLERVVLGNQSGSLFQRAYLRERVIQVFATPGLDPVQRQRLQRLLDRISASDP